MSHSLLQAKRATFTFLNGQKIIKNAKIEQCKWDIMVIFKQSELMYMMYFTFCLTLWSHPRTWFGHKMVPTAVFCPLNFWQSLAILRRAPHCYPANPLPYNKKRRHLFLIVEANPIWKPSRARSFCFYSVRGIIAFGTFPFACFSAFHPGTCRRLKPLGCTLSSQCLGALLPLAGSSCHEDRPRYEWGHPVIQNTAMNTIY